ncbi:Ingression protein fic1 [Fulvia fulva]|uniref:Ingression protein fic1 n=1 Tax=Passalora fulva TaxID=5499 RepID=A0A9Q8PIH8_PASFU|nr:Ingression protein fic1 [Fulvia fulva]KAK4628354.1 Ingression protein fic1 [Fulvia fulva]UJO23083.1 Ingression protein fic1 [Fulvia fulva]
MSSKMATNGPHAAGIFADMTVDGPEIGTLVLIVDRAKNLPNRKTMGKQNPYCAARLGKEARKTETDKRGGQTPRWDQELRFTVHDSPDYYTLKVSVFSEDKRTDLIGEAYVSLNDVVVPGGGKSDQWQGLNCKGKYAGEIRIEMTYYDTREKPDKQHEAGMSVADELKQQYGSLNTKVKRRPLPVNPNAPATQAVVIPDRALPGRAKHGPRDYSTPARAASLPPEAPKTFNYPHSQATLFGQKPVTAQPQSAGPTPAAVESQRVVSEYGEYDPNLGPELYSTSPTPAQPDFLPELGPSRRQRSPLHPQANYAQRQLPPQQHARPPALQHANSAPAVPETHGYEDNSLLRTDYPEAIPDLDHQYQQVRQRRNDVPPGWENEYGSPQAARQPYVEDDFEPSPPPPPPPMHSHSSPAVPHYNSPHSQAHPPARGYGTTPPARRQEYVPSSSPRQSIERDYGPQQTPPSLSIGRPRRGQSFDEYGDSPYQASYGSTPNLMSPQQTPPPGRTPPYGRQHPGRHSVTDLYSTPSRPHPLSQEVSRARSPNPYAQSAPRSRSPNPYAQESADPSPYQNGYRGRELAPLARPRAASPQPPAQHTPDSRPKSSYSIQHPVRAFESADASPLSTSQLGSGRAFPARKSVSPRPSMSEGSRSAIPFSPDDFGANGASQQPGGSSPTRNGPIVGWHGQEIDPSDHLPVEAWAPEPEPKVPNRTYGLGRDRDFGPRGQGIMTTGGRMSKDTMVNVRPRQQSAPPEPVPEPQPSKIRARLVKKSAPPMEPLRDHANFNSVPNSYEQQNYSRGFRDRSPGPVDDRMAYENAYGPPSIPPKVPLQQPDYGPDALSRELSTIDIGTGRRQSPASYVPVRSHRDRNSYY